MVNESKEVKIPYTGSIDITNMCNLKCMHCFNKSNELEREELTDDEFLDVIRGIAKLKLYGFCFCGGETLLRFDLLVQSIKILKEAGTYSVNMVSNGILLTDEKVKTLKNVGIDMIQISLDGSCENTHNRMRGSVQAFRGAIHAIQLLEKNHIQFSVAFCPTNFNVKEISELAIMLNDYSCMTLLRVQPLMVMGRATKNIEPSEEQYRKLVNDINTFKLNRILHFPIQWGDPIDHLIRFRKYLKDDGSFHIFSNGDLTVSPYLPLTIGSLKNHTILEYIEAGLISVWKSKVVCDYAKDIKSIGDLGKPHFGNTVFVDDSVRLDLIDNEEAFVYD